MKNGNQVTWIEMFAFGKRILQKSIRTDQDSIGIDMNNLEKSIYENVEGIQIITNTVN